MISISDKSSPVYKPRRFRPIIYTNLVTSTPAHHQAVKRVKGLFGYSEHYKGNPIEDPSLGKILPLRNRDQGKARELNLELWDPERKLAFLEKFLKAQTNLKKIRIRVMEREDKLTEILKQLSTLLAKCSRINRVQFDFKKEHIAQVFPFVELRVEPLTIKLPKLKDLSVTLDGSELYPFSVGLLNVGFDCPINKFGFISVKDSLTIQTLLQKFHQLDTINIDSKLLICLPEAFLDAIALAISKLPDFRELNLNYSKDIPLPAKPTYNILDTLIKTTPKLHVLKFGSALKGMAQISMLKHPIFKAKSLEKVHISLTFYKEASIVNLTQTFDLLQGISKLYELSLNFRHYPGMNDDIAKGIMEKIVGMGNLRKLRIIFEYSARISEKQAGSIIRAIFKIPLLGELDLELPTSGLDLSGNNEGESLGTDIKGLGRLVKVRLVLKEYYDPIDRNILGVMELLGKCCRLRELELDANGCAIDWEGMTRKLRGLKGLQILKLHVNDRSNQKFLVERLEEWMRIFEGIRSLQDVYLSLRLGSVDIDDEEGFRELYDQVLRNKKYRTFMINDNENW